MITLYNHTDYAKQMARQKAEKTRAIRKLFAQWKAKKETEHKAALLLERNPSIRVSKPSVRRRAI